MKITSLNPYINFVSAQKTELPEQIQFSNDIDAKKEKREKIIKYSIAAAATAAVIIGGLYYIGRHGKKPPSSPDVNIKPKTTPQTKPQEVSVEKPAQSSAEPPKKQQVETTKQEKANTSQETKNVKTETPAVSDRPFDIPDEYFDFAKLKGEREDNVVRQFENGKLVREFYSEDNKTLTLFSEFDSESGFRLHDVEYRPDKTIQSLKEYSNNEFSKMTVYKKDGITVKQVFNDEDSALLYELDNA